MRLLALLLLACAPVPEAPDPGTPGQEAAAPASRTAPPVQLFDVVRVVDGDTIHIQYGDRVEKLRLLSVDTEERLRGNPSASALKPETAFGEACALWAIDFFEALAEGDAPPQVGVRFPESWAGVPRRDIYGRMLCHVLLPDGTDFNVHLVELGKSPYFNKYGNSRICHAEFVAAQRRARAARRGIWDPTTNAATTPGAPSAKRPYDILLPWWQARADAIDGYRARAAEAPERYADAEDPTSLANVFATCEADPRAEVEVFGSIDRFFEEDDGSLTVLFRSGDKRRALRALLPSGPETSALRERLERSREDLRQSYWRITGRLAANAERGGWILRATGPDAWTPAGPEPSLPEAKAPGAR